MKFEAPRGTQDVLPAQQPLWERVIRETEDVCAAYGYRRITTPLFEDTELFTRTSGEGSDVVQKEMYTFTDRGDRSLTLRPEGTASVARAYVEHGLYREPQPVKTFLIGPMYRYAAPQRGKFREFWQLNVEAMGSDDPALDAEVIQLYAELLRRLGIEGWWLELNSIGDRNCRPAYLEQLNEWLEEHADELDEDTLAKRKTSPLRVFDNLPQKPEAVQQALAGAPKIGESLCAECQAHFDAVLGYLDACGVEYRLVPTLVRGLDYYTRTTFEFMASALGAALSLAGGGRYDYLVEEIGGPPTPGGRDRERHRAARPVVGRAGSRGRAARGRRVLRGRGRRGAGDGARVDGRAPPGRTRGRDGLRGPVAQGPAHAGRARRCEGDRDRALRRRDAAPPAGDRTSSSRRSPRRWSRCELARPRRAAS